MTKLAICSDLHLEFADINLQNTENADVLILAGDIMVAQDLHDFPEQNVRTAAMLEMLSSRQEKAQRFRDFFKRCSFQFPKVIYIMGNHEFYHGKFHAAIDYMREECSKYSNFHFLENDTVKINDITFIGGTLWTDCNNNDPLTIQSLRGMMNDFRVIRNDHAEYRSLRPEDIIVRHRKTMSYITSILDSLTDSKIVMVGHHAPTRLSIADEYKKDFLMNGGYASNLSEFILNHPEIVLWVHGHMHLPSDYLVGTTRVVANPRGYAGHEEQADKFQLKFLDI